MLVTLNDLKNYLKIPLATTDYDNFLNDQNAIVSEAIETYCKRKLLTGSYVQTFYEEDFKNNSSVSDLWVSQFPIQSITSVKSVSKSNVETVLTDYRAKKDSGKLVREQYKCWFQECPKKIVVSFTSGYTELPAPIRSVVYSIIEERYAKELRGISMNFGSDVQSVSIPGAISIAFDYSLQANDRTTPMGMILGNHVNVLDSYRSERSLGQTIKEEWVD